jgi:hypothetical protein
MIIKILSHFVSITKTSLLMFFMDTIDIYSENHTRLSNIFFGQNGELFNVKAASTYNNHCSLNRRV